MVILNEMTNSEFYDADLDITALINRLFPTEQSLSLLDTVVQRIDGEVQSLDTEIAELVEKHGEVTSDGMKAISAVSIFGIFNPILIFRPTKQWPT
jgi:hypothetical protein